MAGGTLFLFAQENPKFKVDVDVVNVLATVRDKQGQIVSNLTKDDFVLKEEGKLQDIKYFFRQTDLPLKIGLLVDTSMSQANLIKEERKASSKFLEQVMRPEKDDAFVIKFDGEVELLQDLTDSRPSLDKALDRLVVRGRQWTGRIPRSDLDQFPRLPQWPGSGSPFPGPFPPGGRRPGGRRRGPGGPFPTQMGGTTLYDAVFLAADEVLKAQDGRKAMIVISDGVDMGSKVSEKEAIEAAQRADVIVYCVRYYDPRVYSRFGRAPMGDAGARGASALESISEQTGGRMFEVSKKLSLDEIFAQIQEELRNQYNLGYIPSDPSGSGFRKIELRTVNKDLKVVTRPGYYRKATEE